jgi:hypothetical protein
MLQGGPPVIRGQRGRGAEGQRREWLHRRKRHAAVVAHAFYWQASPPALLQHTVRATTGGNKMGVAQSLLSLLLSLPQLACTPVGRRPRARACQLEYSTSRVQHRTTDSCKEYVYSTARGHETSGKPSVALPYRTGIKRYCSSAAGPTAREDPWATVTKHKLGRPGRPDSPIRMPYSTRDTRLVYSRHA